MAWGMVFPNVDDLPRHPSQLYEFALEGLVLFALLWLYSSKPRPVGAVSGLFLIGYGSFRFLVEYTRNPDDGIFGLMSLGISMGQWLSLPMVIAGLVLMLRGQRKSAIPNNLNAFVRCGAYLFCHESLIPVLRIVCWENLKIYHQPQVTMRFCFDGRAT